MPLDRLAYSIPEVCHLLSLSRSHVYKLIDLGVLPVVLAGRKKLVPVQGLHQWLEDSTVQG